jgi:hypothetical protein
MMLTAFSFLPQRQRGVNQAGFVANEVETEQIVSLDPGLTRAAPACSVVQVRFA